MKRNPKAPIEKCSHCGSGDGYYMKQQVYGTAQYYCHFDGSEADNSSLHDYLNYKQGKIAYCTRCHKSLFKTNELKAF